MEFTALDGLPAISWTPSCNMLTFTVGTDIKSSGAGTRTSFMIEGPSMEVSCNDGKVAVDFYGGWELDDLIEGFEFMAAQLRLMQRFQEAKS